MPRSIGHITVAAVGKLRGRHWQTLQDEYVRRLGRYTDFRLVEVKDAIGRSLPEAVAMAREGEQLLAAMPSGARVILISADGRRMDSPELATYLWTQMETYGNLSFLIGGPLGFASAVSEAAHDRLSLSPMTFTHEMARVILLEQLYRAFTIIHGEPYHK